MRSLLLEAAALARGLDTMRIGPWGFTAGSAPHCADIAFFGNISQETSRSAVRTADDRLMAKTALTEAGLSVPQSRRFGYQDIDIAVRYAQRFRRGAIIKPRMTEAGRISRKALAEPEAVRQSIESWGETAGTHSTYLVERRMFSREYSFVIVGGEVVSVGRRRNRRWEREVTGVRPEVLALAVAAFEAFPAMPHGEVRMFCLDPFAGSGGGTIAAVNPEIGLLGPGRPQAWSVSVAERIIGNAARDFKVSSPVTGGVITAEFTMNELSDPGILAAEINHCMGEVGVDGAAVHGDRSVTGTITGTPGALVALSGLAKAGKLAGESPQTITFKLDRTW